MTHARTIPAIVTDPSLCDEIARVYEAKKSRPLSPSSLDKCRSNSHYRGQLKRIILDRDPPQRPIDKTTLQNLGRSAQEYHYSYGIGLGDVVAKLAATIGIKKKDGCGCGQRQAVMNRWASIGGKKPAINPEDWAVAVTTAPREISTLLRCIKSIVRAGWWELEIISEPGVDLSDYHVPGISTVQHSEKKGCWHNYLWTMNYMLSKYPEKKWFLVVQDDTCLAGPGLRQWCEFNCTSHLNDDRLAIYSLYTSLRYYFKNWKKSHILNGTLEPRPKGWQHIRVGSGMHGACAFIWKREAVEHFVKDWYVRNRRGKRHRRPDGSTYFLPPDRVANIDSAVGRWLQRRSKMNMYFILPSLADHFATTSTINHGSTGGVRAAHDFVGEQCGFDCIDRAVHGE